MRYEKPAVTVLGNAVKVVQGTKDGCNIDSTNVNDPLETCSAYQADE
jgi:hypothetical protein